MKFKIENGLNLISIRISEIGSYLRCRKPLATVWHDCAGSVGKYLCLLPYEQGYRDEVRRRLVGQLNEDYTNRTTELKELIDPLMVLFPSGDYSLSYYSAEGKYFQYTSSGDNYESIRYSGWDLAFSAPLDNRNKELKIEEHRQYVVESKKKNIYYPDLLGFTTGGFYDAFDRIFTATQPMSEIDEERVRYFEDEINKGARPFAIIFNCYFHQIEGDTDCSLQSASYVVDGHHKLLAYRNLKVLPAIVEITHYPLGREEVEFDVEELIDVLYPWQMEHIFKNWDEKDRYIQKYLKNPDSTVHHFIRNGYVKTYHENGQAAHEAFYINDRIEGEGKWWYDDGQLQRVEYFKAGIRCGEWKSWYPSGAVQFVQPFNDKGNYDGHMVSYYESGKVRWEQFIKNGVNLDGYTYLSWFEDGTKEAELEYLNGRMIKRKNYNRSGVMVNFEELDPQTNRLVKRI